MAWDQAADQAKTGQTGGTLETPVAKPSDNASVHSIFISDFLTDNTAKPAAAPVEAAKVAPAPKPAATGNPLFQESPKTYAGANGETPALKTPVQTFQPPRVAENPALTPAPSENFYGMQPQGPNSQVPGRDMTYRAMTRSQQMVSQLADNRGDNRNPGQMAARPGEGVLRRIFQPQPPQDGRRQPPPGVPQEQGRQRLFGRPNRGDAPVAKNEPMQKLEFNAANETGIVKEMNLPAKFKEVPKDPNLAPGEDPIRREFASGNSRVSLYEGRELTDEQRATLKAVLAKPGPLTENMKGYEDTLMLMGSGYFNFFNNPQVSVGKFQGKEALILTDSDPQTKQVGQTIFVRSDKSQYLYAINFQGDQADFANVKKGLDTIKWRPTPDAVAPPAPKKR